MSDLKDVLREAQNTVTIAGVLKTMNLEIKEKDGKRAIAGTLEIETGENDSQTVRVYASEFTKAGAESKAWAGMKTVMETYKSQATHGEEADVVVVTGGKIGVNDYKGRDGQMKESVQISANFINRARNAEELAMREAKATVEMFITSIINEVNREGDETGRAIVRGLVPVYGGKVIPLELVVEAGKKAEYVTSNYERGNTILAHIKLVNTIKLTRVEQEVDFGDPEVKLFKEFVNEMVLTGGKKYEEEDVKAFDVAIIKKAMTEREAMLEAKLKEEDKPKATPSITSKKSVIEDDFPF